MHWDYNLFLCMPDQSKAVSSLGVLRGRLNKDISIIFS